MRIVLDTNVVMSALLWRGPPYRLLERIRQHPRLQLYSSAVLLEELAEVLTRPSATRQLSAIGKAARDVLPEYIAAIELVEPADLPRVVRDPDNARDKRGLADLTLPHCLMRDSKKICVLVRAACR